MQISLKDLPADIHSEFPIIQSVIDGTQKGIILCTNRSYLVCHKFGFAELFISEHIESELKQLLQHRALPQYFHLYNASASEIDLVASMPNCFNFKVRERIQLQLLEFPIAFDEPEGYTCKTVNQSHLSSLEVFQLELTNRFWDGEEDFLRHSMAVLIEDSNNNPISICYSAANASGKAEVDVFTVESHRGLGLTKLGVSRFADNCWKKGLIPNWDCFSDNLPSKQLSMSLGFESSRKYSLLSIFYKLKTNPLSNANT